jgi:hypothetical protein
MCCFDLQPCLLVIADPDQLLCDMGSSSAASESPFAAMSTRGLRMDRRLAGGVNAAGADKTLLDI